MQTIIDNVKAIFSKKDMTKTTIECNYSNNYYGDQCCQQQLAK